MIGITPFFSLLIMIGGIGVPIGLYFKKVTKRNLMKGVGLGASLNNVGCQAVYGEIADRAITLMKVTGMLVAFKYSTQTKLVSRKGQTKAVLLTLLHNVFFGWWGIKSFLFNCAAVLNNISALFMAVKFDSLSPEELGKK